MMINSYRFASSGAFDPLSLSPALWLDFSDASTLYDATSGGSLVAADGLIARANDKAGSRNATQETSSFRPTRKASIINGKDVARFDGVDNGMKVLAPGSGWYGSSLTVFAVFRMASLAGAYTVIFDGYNSIGAGSSGTSALIKSSGKTAVYYFANDNTPVFYDGSGSATLSTSTPYLLSCRITASSFQTWINGTSDANPTTSKTPASSTGQDFWLGFSGLGRFLNGDLAEILVYPSALSTTNRQAVEAYLNAKYALY